MFSLGDTSYEFFCQSEKISTATGGTGGERLLDRVDADVEYQAVASEWRARVVDVRSLAHLSRHLRNPSLFAVKRHPHQPLY